MNKNEFLRAGGKTLPAPVSISVSDQLIWSSDTGRVLSGLMIGDVVAEKKTLSISWGVLEESEVALIGSKLTSGYFPLTFRDGGVDLTIDAYRGTLSKELLGLYGGIYYYKDVKVEVVQR